MSSPGFMHKYYDWAAFETFVKELYEQEGDVVVERDVTDTDKYGARRQTDVKITRRTRFHRFVTLVECKRWKDPVGRDRIDILASSIEALSAQNGAIFTTTGFEEGAIAYAKGKGIELFLVRDLEPEEWGLPGRHISFYLHTLYAVFDNIRMPGATAIALVDDMPTSLNLGIQLGKDVAHDPDYDLFSIKSGLRGPNIVGILSDAHRYLIDAISRAITLFKSGRDGVLEVRAAALLDFSKTDYVQLRLPTAATRLKEVTFTFVAHVSQSKIELDRGKGLDFAVMVESFVSDEKLLAHRKTDAKEVVFRSITGPKEPEPPSSDILTNDTLFRVICAPWVGLGHTVATEKALVSEILCIVVEVENGKPKLSLETRPIPKKAA